MGVRNVKDCFEFRLLRKINPDNEKSKKSLEIAENRLENGKKALNYKMYRYVILEAYMAMFHASRSLLYRDGIQEKSHYAISIYLKEKYKDKIPLYILNYLNIHRTERHEAMYGLEYDPDKEDAIKALDDAKTFIKEVKKVLKI